MAAFWRIPPALSERTQPMEAGAMVRLSRQNVQGCDRGTRGHGSSGKPMGAMSLVHSGLRTFLALAIRVYQAALDFAERQVGPHAISDRAACRNTATGRPGCALPEVDRVIAAHFDPGLSCPRAALSHAS